MGRAYASARETRRRLSAFNVVFFVLVIVYLFPLWYFRYVPSQDGPAHLANAWIIKAYGEPASSLFQRYYVVAFGLKPNSFYHLTLAGLMKVLPPFSAEKVLLTGYVVLFAVAIRRWCRAAAGRDTPAAFLAFPFIYSFTFHMGFFGFNFSLALAALGMAWFWERRENVKPWVFVVMNLYAAFIYFWHLMGWALFLGGVTFLAWAAVLAGKGRRSADPADRRGWREKLIPRLMTPLYLAPAAALGWAFASGRTGGPEGVWRRTFRRLTEQLYDVDPLAAFNRYQKWVGFALLVVLGVAVVVLGLAVLIAKIKRRTTAGFVTVGAGVWAVLTAAILVCYYAVPDTTGWGGGYICDRLLLVVFLGAIACAGGVTVGVIRRWFWVTGPALAVAYVAAVGWGYRDANRVLKEFNAGRWCIARDATVCPMIYLNILDPDQTIGYMVHAGSYYVVASDRVDVLNYEAGLSYFPVNWRPGAEVVGSCDVHNGTPVYSFDPARVDYLICWGINPFVPGLPELFRQYELVHTREHTFVMRRRGLPPPRGPCP